MCGHVSILETDKEFAVAERETLDQLLHSAIDSNQISILQLEIIKLKFKDEELRGELSRLGDSVMRCAHLLQKAKKQVRELGI